MNCSSCARETTLLLADRTGLVRALCAECQVRPDVFAEGTQSGMQRLSDLASHEVQIATARAEAALDALRILVRSFRKEMRGSFSTYEQQQALRRAESLLEGEDKR